MDETEKLPSKVFAYVMVAILLLVFIGPILWFVLLAIRPSATAFTMPPVLVFPPTADSILYTFVDPGNNRPQLFNSIIVAAGAVLALLAGDALPVGTALRFDRRTLRWSEETRTPHPECGCLSPAAPPWPPVPARPGTGTAAGRTGVPAGCRAGTS